MSTVLGTWMLELKQYASLIDASELDEDMLLDLLVLVEEQLVLLLLELTGCWEVSVEKDGGDVIKADGEHGVDGLDEDENEHEPDDDETDAE